MFGARTSASMILTLFAWNIPVQVQEGLNTVSAVRQQAITWTNIDSDLCRYMMTIVRTLVWRDNSNTCAKMLYTTNIWGIPVKRCDWLIFIMGISTSGKVVLSWNAFWFSTVAYLGHGEKTNYSANPPGRNSNPPGRNSQSARAE